MGWISIEDRLPRLLYDVLGITKNSSYFICWRMEDLSDNSTGDVLWGSLENYNDPLEITHWMPLPHLPTESVSSPTK